MYKEMVEKKNDLITRAETIVKGAKEEKRELTQEEKDELNTIKTDVASIDETIKLEDEVSRMERSTAEEEKKTEEKKGENVKMNNLNKRDMELRALVNKDEEAAFASYIRGTMNTRTGELSPAVWVSGSQTAAGSGGALIPTTIVQYIISKVYDICPILERSQKFNVRGKLQIPYYPADSNNITVAYASEFSGLSSTSGSYTVVELSGYLAGCLTKISRSLINNMEFDIVGYVVEQMAYAIARFIEKELLVGTSSPSAKVLGLSTLTNSLTAASASAITADEVIKLHDMVKDQFQRDAIWIMSPSTRTALRLLKANTGVYLLNDDIASPFGMTLLGKPVYVSDNMPNIATGNTTIYYGDMRGLATKFNEDINIEVLRERYADEHAIGVVGWLEFDGKVCDEQQIANLVMA